MKNQSGFSLTEIAVIVVVIGILAAVGVPNFLGMHRRFQANQSFEQIEAALRRAQMGAMQKSQNCTLDINSSAITSSGTGCLLEAVSLKHLTISGGTGTLAFNYRGEVTVPANELTITASSPYYDRDRCITVSYPLGLIRPGAMESGNCVPPP